MRLRDYLALAVGANMLTITGIRKSLGYQQMSAATLAASTPLTLPTVTVNNTTGPATTQPALIGLARIQCSGGTVRWRDDGTDPTASVGMLIADGGSYDFHGDFTALRLILATSVPVVDITLYGQL